MRFRLDQPPGAVPASRWAFDGGPPRLLLRHDPGDGLTRLSDGEGMRREWADPLDALRWMAADVRMRGPSERWVGFLSYDLGRRFETLPTRASDDLGLPLLAFGLCASDGCGMGVSPMLGSTGGTPVPRPIAGCSTFARDAYERAVARAIEYVHAGDVFQVNLAQRITVPIASTPAEAYAGLCRDAPAHYGGLLDFGDFALLSNSPELFLRVEADRRIVTRPIKGTRPRGPGMADELRDSAKDAAELAMIVDLERNDLGRVCEVGSVRVSEPRTIEAHPTVFHGAATVEGRLRPDVDFVALLAATFPGGSVTGAPKIRAMQIIDELEPVRRHAYCGAVGYLAADGSCEFNVAIRTIVCRDGLAHVSVGGGIVADSTPAGEYAETLVKARAMLVALGHGPAAVAEAIR